MAGPERSVGFSPTNAARVARATQIVERKYRNFIADTSPIVGWNPGTKVAKTGGGGIPAMSGTTPGSASVTLYDFDGTNLVAGDTVTAYSNWKTSTGANTWIHVSLVDYCWFVSAEDCS